MFGLTINEKTEVRLTAETSLMARFQNVSVVRSTALPPAIAADLTVSRHTRLWRWELKDGVAVRMWRERRKKRPSA
ncbi:hypothetical protein [Planctomicrobium piriforme]|uniref:Uncharacterized protein n=1 Tax=Planctomicrobium piriforme TaxID=1576369 RepID=A0A1I3FSJ7_9PLAN|nr:hypothetical protein [Planctomicrobium piriforme]SFI14185.1 hypothetical protein SAMN05421753_10610 [Planctomicrobium piriforme]